MKNVNLISSSSHKKRRVYYQITKKYRKTKINLSFCKGFRHLFPKKNYFYFIKNYEKMKLTRIFVPIVDHWYCTVVLLITYPTKEKLLKAPMNPSKQMN